MTKSLLAISIAVLLAGCSMAPAYQRPETPTGADWQTPLDSVTVTGWRQQFNDPQLQRLITLGL